MLPLLLYQPELELDLRTWPCVFKANRRDVSNKKSINFHAHGQARIQAFELGGALRLLSYAKIF